MCETCETEDKYVESKADQLLEGLIKKGYLSRKFDPTRQEYVYSLTDEGRKAADAMRPSIAS